MRSPISSQTRVENHPVEAELRAAFFNAGGPSETTNVVGEKRYPRDPSSFVPLVWRSIQLGS